MNDTENETKIDDHKKLIQEFLEQKNIAIAGISKKNKPGNAIFKKFKSAGYNVVGIHPEITEFDGVVCYASVLQLPVVPDGIFLITRPDITLQIVKECIIAGIPRIWMHNMPGINPGWGGSFTLSSGSISSDAVDLAQKAGIRVVAGSCPMHYIPPVDLFHRCIRWVNEKSGTV